MGPAGAGNIQPDGISGGETDRIPGETERQTDGFSRLPADYQNLMVQMNVADDYFKAKEKAAKLNQKLEEMEKELYQVKHDLITNQLKMESLQKGLMDADQYGEPELFVLNRRTDD